MRRASLLLALMLLGACTEDTCMGALAVRGPLACSYAAPERVFLEGSGEDVSSGETIRLQLQIEEPVDDIIYGNHQLLQRHARSRWKSIYFLYTQVRETDPSFSTWRPNAMHTQEGYSGERELLVQLPPDLRPGAYRIVFEYTDLGQRMRSPQRNGEATWNFEIGD